MEDRDRIERWLQARAECIVPYAWAAAICEVHPSTITHAVQRGDLVADSLTLADGLVLRGFSLSELRRWRVRRKKS